MAADTLSPAAVLPRLARALAQAGRGQPQLALLPDKGLAHHHVRLVGQGLLARVPKQSQLQLDAQANLAYQAACFERASASGHAPCLAGVLPPDDNLPRGALLVQEIAGRAAALPQDLDAIAIALARIHALPVPAPAQRAPLQDEADPLAALRVEIEAQAAYFERAQLALATRDAIEAQLALLRARVAQAVRPARRLIAFDAHPGNFVLRADGRALLVDLEKCRYSYPGLDLAHATLYTSTSWEAGAAVRLSPAQVARFYARWHREFEQAGGERFAAPDWQLPLRRAMWLWSVSWCAKWRVLSGQARRAGGDGEDWSGALSDPALIAHVRDRVDHYLSPAGVRIVLDDFDAFTTSAVAGAAS